MKKSIILLTAALLMLPACEKLASEEREEDLKPEDITPAVSLELTKADAGIRDASNTSGLDVFSRLYAVRDGKDVSFSPLSLSLAFAMVAEGAEGETYKQISDAFGWGDATKEELGAFYKKMIEGLVIADPSVSFTSSNSLWAAQNLVLKDKYKKLLSENFAAESYQVDFSAAATLGKINKWCSDKTDGKIQKMLDELNPATRMMLINALLYKAPWAMTWTVEKKRTFKDESGAKSKKDYLYVKGMYRYAYLDECQAIALPYGNGAYEMVVFLPNPGYTVEKILPTVRENGGKLGMPRTAEIWLPKFSTEYSTEAALPTILMDKGIRLAFTGAADFSGISASEALKISLVLQKVKIDVTEKGTEFAAVTVIGMDYGASPESTPPQPVVFDADHPFVYLIRETSTGTILLVGSMSK